MKISDELAEEFRQAILKSRGVDMPLEEARAALARTVFLVERFAQWKRKMGAEGWEFPLDGPMRKRGDTEPSQSTASTLSDPSQRF